MCLILENVFSPGDSSTVVETTRSAGTSSEETMLSAVLILLVFSPEDWSTVVETRSAGTSSEETRFSCINMFTLQEIQAQWQKQQDQLVHQVKRLHALSCVSIRKMFSLQETQAQWWKQ